LRLDAEALYRELLRGVPAARHGDDTRWSGITSGGAWLAERLQKDLAWTATPASFPRPCTATTSRAAACRPPAPRRCCRFDVNGAHILLLDDVLYTGRTIRAVLNELFDFGRPAACKLAVLVDRGGRELPVQADFAAARVACPIPSRCNSRATPTAASASR
jgi:pyrimidine operon attenuation protein/uracil phosphoribosyltransferase